MANKQSIDEIIHPDAFAQLDKLLKQLGIAKAEFVALVSVIHEANKAIASSKGIKDFEAATNKAAIAQETLNKKIKEKELIEARIQQVNTKTAEIAERNAAREAVAQQKVIDKENARIAVLVKKGKTILSNSQDEIDAYNNTVNGSKKVTTTLNSQNIAEGRASSQAAALTENLEDVSEAQTDVATSTLRVAPAAVSAQRAIRSLEIQLASYQAIAANATDIGIISEFNRRAEQTQDEISRLRNVGRRGFDEFGNAIERSGNGLNRVWSGLRTIANILPGIGIAGVLAFAAGPLIDYIKNLDIFKKSVRDLAKEGALGASEYKQAVSDVNRLGVAVKEFNSGILTSTQLVSVYNEGIGQTAGELRTVAEVEEFYNSKAPNYVQAMFLRAQANAALEIATDKALEAQKRAFDPATIDVVRGYVSAIGSVIKNGVTSADALFEISKGTRSSQKAAVKDLQASAKDASAIFADLQAQADAFAKKSGLNLDGKQEKPKANTDNFDAEKQRLEILQKNFKRIADDEKESFDARIDALREYNEVARSLIKLEANNELQQVGVTDKRKIIINQKTNDALLDQDIEYSESANKIFADQLDEQQKTKLRANQQQLDAINIDEAFRLDLLNKSYANQTISEEQFGKLKLGIQREYLLKYINAEIRQTQELLSNTKLSADDRAKYEEDLAELKLKLSNSVTANQIDDNKRLTKVEAENAKKREKAEQDLSDKKTQLTRDVASLAISIMNSGYENEKNKTQQEIDLNDEKKQREIENVNNSILTEEEKADRISVIEARSASNKDLLEKKQREIDQRKARFQKLAAITEITISTFSAIAKTQAAVAPLYAGLPFTAPIIAATLAQIPFIIASGAVQAGAVLATPIPSYYRGTESSESGPALTDEFGAEGYIEPSGKAYIGSDTPNIKNLKSGTKIIPHKDLVRMATKINLPSFTNDSNPDLIALLAEQKNTNKILKGQKHSATGVITPKAWFGSQREMNGLNVYLQRNLGK